MKHPSKQQKLQVPKTNGFNEEHSPPKVWATFLAINKNLGHDHSLADSCPLSFHRNLGHH